MGKLTDRRITNCMLKKWWSLIEQQGKGRWRAALSLQTCLHRHHIIYHTFCISLHLFTCMYTTHMWLALNYLSEEISDRVTIPKPEVIKSKCKSINSTLHHKYELKMCCLKTNSWEFKSVRSVSEYCVKSCTPPLFHYIAKTIMSFTHWEVVLVRLVGTGLGILKGNFLAWGGEVSGLEVRLPLWSFVGLAVGFSSAALTWPSSLWSEDILNYRILQRKIQAEIDNLITA